MKRNIISLILCTTLAITSCSDWIDVVPDNVATLDDAFKDRLSVEKALSTCYSYMSQVGTLEDPALLCGDDLCFRSELNGTVQPAYTIALNGNNVASPIMSNWHATQGGRAFYQAIRYANYVIDNTHKARDLNQTQIRRYIAEAKVLKAYFHYYLVLQYGPIPIMDKALPSNTTPEESMTYRNTVDEVIDYIAKTISEAVPDLPLELDMIKEAGRIAAPQALCIKAKALVLGASPLFNGNKNYDDFVDNRGVQLINTEFDGHKWERAAEACKNAIDTCLLAGFDLYRIPSATLPGISDATRNIITSSAVCTTRWNQEHIWGRNQGYDLDRILSNYTRARLESTQMNATFTLYFPTLKTDEMFYTVNGVPIDEDKDFDYEHRYELTTVPDSEVRYMQPGVTTAKLHLNREPRFYGTLAVDGGWWFGLGRQDENNQWKLKFTLGAQEGGRIGSDRYSSTGLYIKKWTPWEDTFSGTALVHKGYDFPLIRLADMYLLYAEALNEALDAPTSEVYYYINLVRERAGLEGVETAWPAHSTNPNKYTTKEGMRDIIRAERNIELAFEGHRFWDIRRWNLAIQYFNEPFQGWNADYGTTKEELYQIVTFPHKSYGLKDVLWPIMTAELTKNSNLVQNPGWED